MYWNTYRTHLRFGITYTHSFGTDTHTWSFRPLIIIHILPSFFFNIFLYWPFSYFFNFLFVCINYTLADVAPHLINYTLADVAPHLINYTLADVAPHLINYTLADVTLFWQLKLGNTTLILYKHEFEFVS